MEELWRKVVLDSGLSERWIFILGTFLVHTGLYISLNAFLLLARSRRWFAQYLIQPDKLHQPHPNLVRECLTLLFFNHFVTQIPTLYFLYPVFKAFGMRCDLPLPSIQEILSHFVIFLIINDTGFYWAHRTLHHEWFYKRIHAKHHRFTTSIGLASEFAHPVEQIIANQLPSILGALLLGSHVFTFWLWLTLRIIETIDAHSGYDFPLSPFSLLPFVNGADRHDFHHSHNRGNFGSFFVFWDWIMGTDKPYLEWKAQQEKQQQQQQKTDTLREKTF
jgi:4-alpha-methyl-delta7-sterol-4alpha-methyl oxidase